MLFGLGLFAVAGFVLTTRGLPRFTELRGHVYEEIQRAKREAGTRA